MSSVSDLVADFGQTIGLKDLALDEKNCCTLQFDHVVVNLEYLPESEEFYFYSRVWAVPENGETRLRTFTYLLETDCFFRGTSGGVLGVDMARDAIIYTNKVGTDGWRNANVFGDYVQAFVNLAEEFEAQIREITTASFGNDGETSQDSSELSIRSGMAIRV
ncbi:MAG: type III secretion system chaperone [Desulfobacterium sp.]|nr:type III secretion system chaperone [Desulfobacterium sp.]